MREEQLLASPLAAVAKQWEANEYSDAYLLDGRQLEQASRTVKKDDADPLVIEFLKKSEEVEKMRQMREANKKAEEAEREAEREKALNHRLRLQRAAIFTLAVLMLFAAAVAGWHGKKLREKSCAVMPLR